MRNYGSEVYVYRAINGSSFNGTDAVTVNLTSSDPSKLTVPATVTIPANSFYAYFQVTGVDLTGGTPVTIDATATGYTTPVTKLAGNVVPPVLNLQSLDNSRSTTHARDNFNVVITVPGSYGNQTIVADLPIDLAVVNANPAGIVDGFYSALTGGTAVTQVLIPASNNTSTMAYASHADSLRDLSGASQCHGNGHKHIRSADCLRTRAARLYSNG